MGHEQASYTVKRTTGLASLAPVTLRITRGGWKFLDYLTCEEAELLAGTLRARARQVREERERAREQVMSDLEVLSRAARTPFTPETTKDLRTHVGSGIYVKPLGHTPPSEAA